MNKWSQMVIICMEVMFGFCGYKTHRNVTGDVERSESREERDRKGNIDVMNEHHGIRTDLMLCQLEGYHLSE